jgi:hypothetical protein
MARTLDKPIAFLDVDGTLLPFRARPAAPAPPRAGRLVSAGNALGNPLLQRLDPADGPNWKTAHLARWAAGRPFIWLDDEVTDTERQWIQGHYPGKALLHRVDSSVGLADRDFDHIREWLAKL